MIRLWICLTGLFCLTAISASGQLRKFFPVHPDVDSSYVEDQSGKLLLRVFAMQKFNKYTLGENGIPGRISYRANDNYNLGIGGQYKWLGANVSFRMPFVNQDDGRFGETKFFDLQSYLYFNRLALDLYILSYKGYYLANSNVLAATPPAGTLLTRPDLHTGDYGFNTQYIFNYRKFSYKAAYIQNQCQLRSAGSVIAGLSIHYTRVRADSAIIPLNTLDDNFFLQHQFNKSAVFSVGVNAGYAYTQVIGRHFFVTGSLVLGTGFNYVTLETDANNNVIGKIGSQLHSIMRAAAGYNQTNYFIGVQYANFLNRNNTPVQHTWEQLQAGNFRLTYAKRFKLNKKLVKRLNEIEDSIME